MSMIHFQDSPLIDGILKSKSEETTFYAGGQSWNVRKGVIDLSLTGTLVIRFYRGREDGVEWTATEVVKPNGK